MSTPIPTAPASRPSSPPSGAAPDRAPGGGTHSRVTPVTVNKALSSLLLFLLCLALPLQAFSFAVGDKAQTPLVLGDKQIPLPEGEWVLVGQGPQAFEMPELGAFGTIQTTLLAKLVGKHLVALAEINTNTIPVTDGWGRTAACKKGDQFLLITRYKTGWDLACFFIIPTPLETASGPGAWQEAKDNLNKAGVALPKTALTVGFRTSDRQDIVDLRLHFNPAFFPGLTASEIDTWTPAGVKTNANQLRVVEMLSAWALGVDGWIEQGIANGLSNATPVEGPQRAAILSDTPLIDRKLADLERLQQEQVIDATALAAQQQQALTERPLVIEQTGGLPNSVKKNISFRVFGSIVDYILAYAVTLSAPVSAAITASIITVHSVIFVLNDHFWEDYFAQQSTRDANRMVDFVYIGGSQS